MTTARPLVLLLGLLAAGAARAQPQPLPNAATPNIVNRTTAEAFAQCRQAGGHPEIRAGYHTNFELTSDNRVDVILDMAKLECGGASGPLFCGSAGCQLRVFVTSPQGLRLALEVPAQRWSSAIQQGRPVLALSLHASQCGGAACEKRLVWNGQAFADQRSGEVFAPTP
ncbi:hypothetical protein [Paracraurococcus ruber]|uniref:Uncharacterized protein n=1 Tax=Paracraurococcus ruber TaxID=77675 RepID=A0ABS1D7F4_9PROT|nr:hypothetical protein [Paracraurococcus ruber]MBK1661804.1 hypothetical protein [Paracraurococcus ruber]TDG31592.1 hypothetical protein E2C05_10330 [Paracraurococcus ruber]